jgi:DNA-binding CsgD family transcriptional regulator
MTALHEQVVAADYLLGPTIGLVHTNLARARAAAGDTDGAREAAEAAVTVARVLGTPSLLAGALRARALVAPPAAAMSDLREAADALAGSAVLLYRADAYFALGAALRAAGDVQEARVPLHEALALAERCGAGPLADAAWEELRASGEEERPVGQGARVVLTPAEERVARLAAEGQSDRDIAQALFISIRAVEDHLRAIYTKLGVATRSDLPGVMVSEPPTLGEAPTV